MRSPTRSTPVVRGTALEPLFEYYWNEFGDLLQDFKRLKEENVEGLLIDLRNNGGGSLKTAIEIANRPRMELRNAPVARLLK